MLTIPKHAMALESVGGRLQHDIRFRVTHTADETRFVQYLLNQYEDQIVAYRHDQFGYGEFVVMLQFQDAQTITAFAEPFTKNGKIKRVALRRFEKPAQLKIVR